MNRSREFGALLRRSSKPTASRALLLFYALLDRASRAVTDANVHDDSEDDWSTLSLASLLAVLRFCFPGVPPRFLFVLGENGHVLRSADRGLSWKRMLPSQIDAATATTRASTCGGLDGDATLAAITGLLPKDDDAAEADSAPSASSAARAKSGPRIRCLAASQDLVVCGGDDGLLLLSGNRGVTFQVLPHFFRDALGSCADAKSTNVDRLALMPDSPSVTSSVLLCATLGRSVVLTNLSVSGVDAVSATVPRVALTCATPIVALHCDGCASSSPSSSAGQIVVSEHRFLHISWDGGLTFWRVPHQLGHIRDMASTACTRHKELSPFPRSSRIVKSLTAQTTAADAPTQAQGGKAGAFEYSSALEQTLSSEAAAAALRHSCAQQLRYAADEDAFFTHLFISGGGTDVLPYDYSCVLCVGVAIRGCVVTTFSWTESVSFIPYIRSPLSEPVCCCVQRHLASAGGPTFTRGNSSGTSFSRDGTNWTDPQNSAAVALLAADGDELIVVGQRGVVTQFSPGTTSSHVLPATWRVPTLRAAAVL